MLAFWQCSWDHQTAGCAGGSDTNGGLKEGRPENEIHIAVYGAAASSAEEAAAERFNQTSDVEVVIDKLAGDDTCSTAMRTSLGTANAPDTLVIGGASDLTQRIDAGAILPLDDFIAKDPAQKDSFIPTVFNEEVVDGKADGIRCAALRPPSSSATSMSSPTPTPTSNRRNHGMTWSSRPPPSTAHSLGCTTSDGMRVAPEGALRKIA